MEEADSKFDITMEIKCPGPQIELLFIILSWISHDITSQVLFQFHLTTALNNLKPFNMRKTTVVSFLYCLECIAQGRY